MTSDRFQVNTFGGGMNTDTDLSLVKSSQYIYAENVRVIGDAVNTSGVLLSSNNVELLTDTVLEDGDEIIGITTIGDTSIIFTKNTSGSTLVNRIIRIDFSNSGDILNKFDILKGNYGLTTKISVVGNKEDINIEKVYFADGVHMIRVLDITKPVDTNNFTIGDLDIIPDSTLKSLQIENIGTGSLKAGKYQYAYQLFTKVGSGTELSQFTSLVSISNAGLTDDVSLGDVSTNRTNKSISLTVDIPSKSFVACRLYSVYYPSNTALPTVSIVADFDTTSDSRSFVFTDDGSASATEITVQELNSIIGARFIPTVLEKLDNRLFAANSTDSTWDLVGYDTRAYRCNRNGEIKLLSNSEADIVFSVDDVNTQVVPENHDCINPDLFVTKTLFDDSYSYKEKVTTDTDPNSLEFIEATLGGIGKNISYSFVAATLSAQTKKKSRVTFRGVHAHNADGQLITFPDGDVARDPEAKYKLSDGDAHVEVKPEPFNQVMVAEVIHTKGDIVKQSGYNLGGEFVKISKNIINSKMNFSNPIIADKFRGYTRGEIYRFGIVFYNKKGSASPVHWIGDIKMPTVQQFPLFTEYEVIGNDKSFETSSTTYSLGIKFEVKNLPEEVTRYEIVRCQRTMQDRTIFAKGVLSLCTQPIKANDTVQPLPFLTCNEDFTLITSKTIPDYYATAPIGIKDGVQRAKSVCTFITPELCYNKSALSKAVNRSMYLETTGALLSALRDLPNSETAKTNTYDSAPKMSTYGSYLLTNLSNPQKYMATVFGSSVRYVPTNGEISTVDLQSGRTRSLVINGPALDFGSSTTHDFFVQIAKYFHRADYSSPPDVSDTTAAKYRALYGVVSQIDDIKYAKPLNWSNTPQEIAANVVSVGNRIYTNWTSSKIELADGAPPIADQENYPWINGPYGYCFVIKLKDKPLNSLITTIPELISKANNGTIPINNDFRNHTPVVPNLSDTNTILTCDLKQNVIPYGGVTNEARLNSVYISSGELLDSTSSRAKYCFGGDTYTGLFYYNINNYWEGPDPNDPAVHGNKMYFGAYIPMESSINFQFKQDIDIGDSTDFTKLKYIQNDAGQVGKHFTQTMPPYAYDDAYSAQPLAKRYVSKSKRDTLYKNSSNRISNSLAKTNGEFVDNWCRFKLADFIDVDNRYGAITNLKVFNNKLYYWQINAFGIASVNERSLIKDNNIGALTLGTAGVLARYDYASTTYGNSVTNDKSIINTDTTLYWYDFDKNEILGYGGSQLHNLSKVKNVQGYVNSKKLSDKNHAVSFYDSKHNEVVFRTNDKGSLVFNEALGVFTSVYSITIPENTIKLTNALITTSNKDFVLHTKGDANNKYGNSKSIVKFVINNDYEYTKVFDNVFFNGDLAGEGGSYLNAVNFNTKSQKGETVSASSITNREGTFAFNVSREVQASAGDYPERLRGKYLICEYEFGNLNYTSFRIPQIRTTYRYSLI